MAPNDFEPLRALLHRAIARYLTITSRGVILADEAKALPRVVVRIMGYGGARTLYRKRKPVCRSLDGVAAVAKADKRCAECADRDTCTPQVRVDLIVRGRPYRLLLAFTGARVTVQGSTLSGIAVSQCRAFGTSDRRKTTFFGSAAAL